jgi:hypothetical protein
MLPPRLDSVSPLGGQRGTEIELTLRGQRLNEPQALLLSRPGIEVVEVKKGKDATVCTINLRLAADCPLGAHPLRLRTAAGLSNLCQLFVGAAVEIVETRVPGAPQVVTTACTIDGAINGEETDCYQIALPQGGRCIAELEAMRLGRGPIDLALSVRDPGNCEIARVDDTALGHKDPWLAFEAKTAGVYEVRVEPSYADSTNAGPYRLHLGDLPRPTAALPGGGAIGSTLTVTLIGDAMAMAAEVLVPDDCGEWFAFYPSDSRGTAPTPLWLRAGGPPEITPATEEHGAAMVTIPCSISGVVTTPTGMRYRFAAKKSEVLELRALALGSHSPLDPVLVVHDEQGALLAADDDAGAPASDSFLRFTAPLDGNYVVTVSDQLGHCGALHVFRLECGSRPRVTRSRLVLARGQEPVLNVPQGGNVGMVLQFDDTDFDAGQSFVMPSLPQGVTATFGRLQKGVNLVPLMLSAALDAPLCSALAMLAMHNEIAPFERPAGYAQVLPLVSVRNDQPILTTTQRRLPIAVTAPAPFTVDIIAPKVPLVRGAPMAVQIHVHRREGFAGEVRLKTLWTPSGVGGGEVTLPANTDNCILPLDANGNAPLGPFAFAVLATATEKDEGFMQCSPFIEITIEKPWLTAQTQGGRTTVGTTISLPIELKGEHALQGPLQVQLLALPRGATSAPITIAADATATTLPVTIAADAATGKFRELMLEIRVPHEGATVIHRFPVGELRIDPPKKSSRVTQPAKVPATEGKVQRP